MADLSGRGGGVGSDHGTRSERGQLILVAAVGIGALLLTLSLLLNAAVYTENLAARGGHAEQADAAVDHRLAAERAVGDLLSRSNAEGWSYTAFHRNVSTWNDLAARGSATDGVTTSVAVSGTNATRVLQTEATRNLTNVSYAERWTVVSGVSAVEAWQFDLSRSSLVVPNATTNASDLGNASAFTVEFTAGETWRLFVYQDGVDTVSVAVDDGTDPLSPACTATEDADGTVTVNVTAATVGGSDCPALASLRSYLETAGSYDVTYENGGNAAGTYTLWVREPISAVDDGDFAADGGSPTVEPYIVDVSIDVTYTTRGLTFRDEGIPITEGSS